MISVILTFNIPSILAVDNLVLDKNEYLFQEINNLQPGSRGDLHEHSYMILPYYI